MEKTLIELIGDDFDELELFIDESVSGDDMIGLLRAIVATIARRENEPLSASQIVEILKGRVKWLKHNQ